MEASIGLPSNMPRRKGRSKSAGAGFDQRGRDSEVTEEARLRKAGLAVVAEWEAEHGAFTEEELAEARIRVREEMKSARSVGRRAAEHTLTESAELSADLLTRFAVHSLRDFKRNTSEFLARMRLSGHPVILTINGRAELVVQDAQSYRTLLERLDELEAVAAVMRGVADVEAGRVTPLRQFEKEFRRKR